MKASTIYTAAFALMVNGCSIIPIGKDKKPLLKSWKQYQTTPADEDQIAAWWQTFPEANIGIVTGKVSGITVVDLDVDPATGETRTPLDAFPPTYTVRTGNGGYHLYYDYAPGLTISAGAYPQFPGVDIRNDGGFVVGPFSLTSYIDPHTKLPKGGEYTIHTNAKRSAFPSNLFPAKRERRALSTKLNVATGGRNDSIASFAGQLLHSAPEEEWLTEVWPAVQHANKTYSPPLPERELKSTFESILNKEKERRHNLIVSPYQLDDGEKLEISIRKNGNGVPYKDMANVLAVLSQHPYYKDAIKYNEFRQEIEYNGATFEEGDLIKIQYFMQTDAALHGINKEAIYAAVSHYASQHRYDEVKDWLESLTWDKTPRLHNWIHQATGVADDSYHAGVGAQWFMGMIRRIMIPGSTFDYVLLMVGPQGIGKTSFFRILGGKWYKSYTGAMDNKDFYLALRGALIIDLDEGAALYRSEAIKIKSIITETHDEFRAPYDRITKKYPRRFVFSMSTNDTEPFRDMTGNRRYWAIDANEPVKFNWLTDNRDQLFAEAYYVFKNNLTDTIPQVPFDRALEIQDMHLPEDSWTDRLMDILQKDPGYCRGDIEYFTTIPDLYARMFPDEQLSRLGKSQEMRIANILKNRAGFEKRRVMADGERKMRWMLTPERVLELAGKPLDDTRDLFELHDTNETKEAPRGAGEVAQATGAAQQHENATPDGFDPEDIPF